MAELVILLLRVCYHNFKKVIADLPGPTQMPGNRGRASLEGSQAAGASRGAALCQGEDQAPGWDPGLDLGSKGWGERAPSARGPARALPTAQQDLACLLHVRGTMRPGDHSRGRTGCV